MTSTEDAYMQYFNGQDWSDWKVADFPEYNGTSVQHSFAYLVYIKKVDPQHVNIAKVEAMLDSYFAWYIDNLYTNNWFMEALRDQGILAEFQRIRLQ